MIHLKRFLDKVTLSDSKQSKDVVLPIAEARGLRDEISKLLSDLYEHTIEKTDKDEVISIEIKGGKFK